MILIEKIPELDWSDTAREELELTGKDLIDQSSIAYQIGNVAIAGLIHDSFTSPPWFWFALAKGVTLRELLDFRRYTELIPKGAMTGVNANCPEAIKFAKLFGFEDIGQSANIGGNVYRLFRRK